MYYIFCCTQETLRARHYDTFMHIYHGSLSDFLRKLGSDPEKLFPYSALQDQLKRFGKFGLLLSLTILQALIVNAEDVPDMDEVAENLKKDPEKMNLSMYENPCEAEFNRRILAIVHDMDKLGYI